MALSRAERRNRAHWIYFLRCPYSFEIRYVGKTTNVKQRAKAHRSKHTSTAKQAWIEELNSQGKEFIFDAVLGPVNSNDADRIENILIIRLGYSRKLSTITSKSSRRPTKQAAFLTNGKSKAYRRFKPTPSSDCQS